MGAAMLSDVVGYDVGEMKHLTAVDWGYACQEELKLHPRAPEHLFGDLHDWWEHLEVVGDSRECSSQTRGSFPPLSVIRYTVFGGCYIEEGLSLETSHVSPERAPGTRRDLV